MRPTAVGHVLKNPPSPAHSLTLCPISAAEVPFSRWSKDEVCAWLQELGLGLYVAQCQIWVKSGQTLLQASQHDLEKVSPSSPRGWQRLITH